MESIKFDILEEKVLRLIESHVGLMKENERLKEELAQVEGEKGHIKERVEILIQKLDGFISEA
ncbi:MAG: hypothetical protein ACE5D4_00085 [Thermodesulfobacteriota bacterium]